MRDGPRTEVRSAPPYVRLLGRHATLGRRGPLHPPTKSQNYPLHWLSTWKMASLASLSVEPATPAGCKSSWKRCDDLRVPSDPAKRVFQRAPSRFLTSVRCATTAVFTSLDLAKKTAPRAKHGIILPQEKRKGCKISAAIRWSDPNSPK